MGNVCFINLLRLPAFTEEQKRSLKGTSDFLALNFYSVSYAEHHDLSKDENVTWGYFTDQEMKASRDPSWLKGQCTFLLPTCHTFLPPLENKR